MKKANKHKIGPKALYTATEARADLQNIIATVGKGRAVLIGNSDRTARSRFGPHNGEAADFQEVPIEKLRRNFSRHRGEVESAGARFLVTSRGAAVAVLEPTEYAQRHAIARAKKRLLEDHEVEVSAALVEWRKFAKQHASELAAVRTQLNRVEREVKLAMALVREVLPKWRESQGLAPSQ